ncbi:MAG: Uma2 family endonuclease [Thermoanaerobaculia bacterium]
MGEPAHPLTFPWNDEDRPWPDQGRWTYDDYARLPDDGNRYEVIRGNLYVTPAPNFDHQYVIAQLTRLLGNFGVETGLGFVLGAPFDILLPEGIASPVQPDLAFFLRGNQPRSGDKNFRGVPDLVVEVESPSTRKRDRTIKLEAYRDAGAPEYWRAEPRSRVVRVLALSEDRTRYVELGCYGAGEMIRSALLPGLAIPLDTLFPPA